MRSVLRLCGVIGLLVAVMAALLPVGSATAAGSVEPSAGGPGTIFSFTAGGYRPGERVGVWVNTPSDGQRDVDLLMDADEGGQARWQWTAPANAESGIWGMVAQGHDSRTLNLIQVQISNSAPQPTPAAADGVTPASGSPGTLFSLTAAGFQPAERLETWANTPEGRQQDVPTYVFANDAGVVMDADSADSSQAFAFTDFTKFSNQLQGQPHGAMHCAVGSGCVMPDIGLVPIAGADPVFYMHHSNIDRLWQCWMVRQSKGKPIDLAWAKANLSMPDSWYAQSYTFIDENGKPVTVKVADVFSPEYSPKYDQLQNCGARPSAKRAAVFAKAAGSRSPLNAHQALATNKPITLGNDAVDVALKPMLSTTDAADGATESDEPATGHTYLVLEDVKLVGLPSLTYKVYVTSKSNPDKASYVATFSYFGTGPAHADHGDANSLGDLIYQISGNLAEIGIESASDISVRFVPTNLLVGQDLKKQPENSGVTVGNIRLQTSDEAPSE